MISLDTVRTLALSFPDTDEHPHFERKAFRVRKKIFATLDEKDQKVVLKLTPSLQSVFCSYDKAVIYPVPGAWGLKGWTIVELKKVRKSMFRDALTMAFCTVAPRQLAKDFEPPL